LISVGCVSFLDSKQTARFPPLLGRKPVAANMGRNSLKPWHHFVATLNTYALRLDRADCAVQAVVVQFAFRLEAVVATTLGQCGKYAFPLLRGFVRITAFVVVYVLPAGYRQRAFFWLMICPPRDAVAVARRKAGSRATYRRSLACAMSQIRIPGNKRNRGISG
jgi:hypothetical protein